MIVCMKQKCVIEFLHLGNTVPTDIHWFLLNIYGDQKVDVNTVRWWVVHSSSGTNDVKDKTYSGWPWTAITPQNEESHNQLICTNLRITIRELCVEMNISFNTLENTGLEYCKV